MKNAIIFHGTDCTPEDFWYPWLKKHLEEKGYTVTVPSYPEINHESVAETLPKALENKFDADTVLIGHSAGSPLILAILEKLDVQVKQAILVAGYANRVDMEPDPILKPSYDWEKISNNVSDIIFLNSDNDPWKCDDKAGRYMLDNIGKGKLVIMKGEGHMGSTSYNQPYKEFPFLLKLIE